MLSIYNPRPVTAPPHYRISRPLRRQILAKLSVRAVTRPACRKLYHWACPRRASIYHRLTLVDRNIRTLSTTTKHRSWFTPRQKEPIMTGPTPDFTPAQMEPLAESSTEELLTRRVHLLGMGSIGTLVAHSFKTLPNPPPITIMMRGEDHYNSFRRTGSCLRLVDKSSGVNDEQFDFDIDVRKDDPSRPGGHYWVWEPAKREGRPENHPINLFGEDERMDTGEIFIYTLIVSVKAQQTVAALRSVAHRLDSRSTICLMQNGLGQVDELNERVFTDPATRPTYILGIISHGCYMDGPNTVVHAGFGTTSLGIYRDTDKHPLPPKTLSPHTPSLSDSDRKKYYPNDEELYSSLSSRYLLRTLTRSPTLACAPYPYLDLLQLQLEKLVSNALLNPITSIFDIPNGATLTIHPISTIQNLLLAEISLVIRSLPELQGLPNVQQRFSAARLKNLYTTVATKTAKNSSSMREDFRLNRTSTEIDYINGYIVKRGEELGIQCALNYMICQMIRAKLLVAKEARGAKEDGDGPVPYGTVDVFGDPIATLGREGDGVGVLLDDKGSKMKGEMT